MSALIAELKIWICLAPVEFIWKCVRKTSRLHKRDISEWEQVSLVSYVGFPATAGEIEVQRHTQLLKGLEFITESLSGKLPQRVLIPLSRFLHLPPLRERERELINHTDHPDTTAHFCSDNNHSICHYFQSLFSWIKAQRFDKECGDNCSHFYFNKRSDINITHQNSSLEYLIIISQSQHLWNYAKLFSHSIHPLSLSLSLYIYIQLIWL